MSKVDSLIALAFLDDVPLKTVVSPLGDPTTLVWEIIQEYTTKLRVFFFHVKECLISL